MQNAEEYANKYFYDEEDIVLTYLEQGTLQDKLDFVGIPASDIRGSIDAVVEDTIANMPDDVFHEYAMKYCKELMEKGIRGKKYIETKKSAEYEEDTADRLSKLIASGDLRYEQGKESTDYKSAAMESPENEEEIESKMALMADFSYYSEYASGGGVFTATTSRKYGILNGKYYIVEKYDDEISSPSISTNELSLADYLSQLAKEYMESYRDDTELIAAYGSVDALETNGVAKAHIYDDFIRDRIINDYVDVIEDFAVTGLPENEKGETIICLVDNNGISFEFNDSTGQLYLINKNNIFRTIEIKMTDNLVKKIDSANYGSIKQANAEKTKPKEIERQ